MKQMCGTRSSVGAGCRRMLHWDGFAFVFQFHPVCRAGLSRQQKTLPLVAARDSFKSRKLEGIPHSPAGLEVPNLRALEGKMK